MKKEIMSLVLAAGLLTAPSFASGGFADIKSTAWYKDNVEIIAEKGLIKGYPDGTFKPDNTLTYGEFIKMITIAVSGEDVGNCTNGSHWAENYYNKAIQLGLFSESDMPKAQSLKYLLDGQIDRRHMALMIGNYLKDMKIKEYNSILKTIKDIKSGDDFEVEIVKSYSAGILNGYDDKTFRPDNTLARKEAATVLIKVIDESKRTPVTVETLTEQEKQEQADKEKIEEILQQKMPNNENFTYSQAFGYIKTAEEFKERAPLDYMSLLRPKTDPLLSTMVTNVEDMYTLYKDQKKKTYAFATLEDLGITEFKVVKNPYNSEYIEGTIKYEKCSTIRAILIKGDKIICDLFAVPKAFGRTNIAYIVPEEFYNRVVRNNKLPDFDYIGFYTFHTPTVFLVKNPF